MASSIDPTKPQDGIPAAKADLRDNLQVAKDEIEALQAGATVPAEERAANHAYAAGDFPAASPLYILATPPAGGLTLTFPDPLDFGLTTSQMRHIAVVTAKNANFDVTIACANASALKSQPGTDGWDSENTSPVRLGRTLALQNEATVSIFIDGIRNLMIVQGAVRA